MRFLRMLSWRRWPFVVGLLGLLVLAVAWVGWQAWQVNKDLNAAVDDAAVLQAAVSDGDLAAAERALDDLTRDSAAAADRTSGATWSVLTRVPVLGDDARGVRTASEVIADLSSDGMEPLIEAADGLESLLPRDGAIPVRQVRRLQEPVTRGREALARAEERLAVEDPADFVDRFGTKYRELQTKVRDVRQVLDSAGTALEVMPTMLGGEGRRQYLLVLQNNAEIRALGGLAGSVSVIEAEKGAVSLVRQVPVSGLGEADSPVLPLSRAERDLYGEVLGTYAVNATMSPDPARAADLLKARWNREFPAERVDGVVLVDAVALSYVIEATGGISVGGRELTGDNLVGELLHSSYLRLPEPARQDAFFAQVAAAGFERFSTGLADGAGLVRALERAASERRVLLHTYDEDERRSLEGTAVSGALQRDPDARSPQVMVTLDDTTGAKMSYFLRYEVGVKATWCTDGVQGYAGTARLLSVAPENAATLPTYVTGGGQYGIDAGSQLVTLRIYPPAGGELGELRWNGAPMEMERIELDGREVGMTYVQLDPGQKVDLAWTMRSGTGQIDDGVLVVTPTIDKTDNVKALPSACR